MKIEKTKLKKPYFLKFMSDKNKVWKQIFLKIEKTKLKKPNFLKFMSGKNKVKGEIWFKAKRKQSRFLVLEFSIHFKKGGEWI